MLHCHPVRTEDRQGVAGLVRLAIDLGAERVGGPLSPEEKILRDSHRQDPLPEGVDRDNARNALARGDDPFAEPYLDGMPKALRYRLGVVLTPHRIVKAMLAEVAWASPRRVVDMGCGTGRFSGEAARQVPDAKIIAVDIDPLGTLLTRARLAALGHRNARVVCGDYVDLALDRIGGTTAFVGNPPYARHHELSSDQKAKAAALARGLGFPLSGLSGLHAHFLFATAANSAPGDVGCVITSAEWMMVTYGEAVRNLLAGPFGLKALHLLDPAAMAFPETMTTAVILTFHSGGLHTSVSVTPHATPETLGRRNGKTWEIRRKDLTGTTWGHLLWKRRPIPKTRTAIPLRDLFRVHRGIATGDNSFFVMTAEDAKERRLLPWMRPVLTRAKEVMDAKGNVRRGPQTKMILALSKTADLDDPDCAPLREYLAQGEVRGVPNRYLCAHRRPWWWLGDREPAPIVATYMARRPPAFAQNPDRLLNLNVIHGLYPTKPLDDSLLHEVVKNLNAQRERLRGQGRVYQGGLEKFEPRELEAVRVAVGPRFARSAEAT